MSTNSKEYSNAYREAHKENAKRSQRKYYAKTAYAPNHQKEWTDSEHRLLLELYEKIGAVRLSEILKRSVAAVHTRHYLLTADDSTKNSE